MINDTGLKFYYQKLVSETNNVRQLCADVARGEHHPGQLWGAFTGLFGMASNELIVVSALSNQASSVEASAVSIESEVWLPTARPEDATPCVQQGLYVFRRFACLNKDVAEFVELSRQAWQTFEGTSQYAAQPMGLFQPLEDAEVVRMMLVTWYDGFASWQSSRAPAADARLNFSRRQALTLTTTATATGLVSMDESMQS